MKLGWYPQTWNTSIQFSSLFPWEHAASCDGSACGTPDLLLPHAVNLRNDPPMLPHAVNMHNSKPRLPHAANLSSKPRLPHATNLSSDPRLTIGVNHSSSISLENK